MSAVIFANLDPVFTDFEPDWVLAQGDTTTVTITALLAYYRRITVGHVEAGLRTWQWQKRSTHLAMVMPRSVLSMQFWHIRAVNQL